MAAGYVSLDGTGDYISTANKAQLQLTGNVEIIINVHWFGAATDTWLVQKANSAETQGYGFLAGRGDGELTAFFGDGTGRYFVSTAALPGGGGAWANPIWLRCRIQPNNGSGGRSATFHYSFEPPETPVGSITWTQLGATVTESGATAISTSTDIFEICRAPWDGDLIEGSIFYAQVNDGIGGSPVYLTDFRTNTGGWDSPPGDDGLGNTINFNGDAVWVPPPPSRLQFIDSAHTGDGAGLWPTFAPGSVQTSGSPTNRSFYRNSNNAEHMYAYDGLGATTVLAGWWGRLSNLNQDNSTDARLFTLTNGTNPHLTLCVNSSGAVVLRAGAGNGTSLASSGDGVITVDDWYHWEVKVVLDNSAGSVQVWITPESGSSTLVLNFNGDTLHTTGLIDEVLWGRTTAGNWDASDFAISIDQDSPNGPGVVWFMLPNAVGSTTDLSQEPNTGDNYQKVDEAVPNDDTDYVYGDTQGDYDTYNLTNLPSGEWDVIGVQVETHARKTNTGAKFFRPVLRVDGTDYPGTTHALTEDYEVYVEMFDVDPADDPWDSDKVDSLQVGPEIRDGA